MTALRAAGWALTILYFLGAALILGLRYWLLPNITAYSGVIEQAVSRTLGERVTIGAIRAGWQGLLPEFDLTEVRIHDREGRVALLLPAMEATVSWTTVVYGSIRFHSLAFERPDLEIRRDSSGRIFIAGMELKDDDSGPDFSDWLLSQREIVIRDARLSWDDAQRAAPRLTLTGVHFAIRNSGDVHRFGLRAQAPREFASSLDVRGELHGASLAQLQDWTGRLFADIDYIDLAVWQRWFDYPLEIGAGRGALRVWLGFADRRLTEVTADVALSQVAGRAARDLPGFELATLQGRLGARESRVAIEVFGNRVSLKAAKAALAPADFSVRWESPREGRPQRGEFQADSLDLRALAALAEYLPLPREMRKRLAEIDPGGSVFDLKLSWTGEPDHPQHYGLRGRFAALQARAWRGIPGFQGLSGRVDGNDKGGNLLLNSEKLSVDLPGILPQGKVQLDTLNAQVSWQLAPEALELKFANLALANGEMSGTLFGSFVTKAGSPGVIDLTGNFPRFDARAAHRTIPWLPEPVREYLRKAMAGGRASDVRLRLKGDLRQFPFAEPGQGTFQVAAKIDDADFNYVEGWPKLSGLSGELIFEGRRMQVLAARGSVLGARVVNAKALIPDLFHGDELLQVEGQAEGPAAEFLRFVEASPVTRYLDDFTRGMSASGNARLQLKLAVPLRKPAETRVSGSVLLAGNQVTIDADVPPFSQVNGRMEFTESGMSARTLSSQFLGGPSTISVSTLADGTVTIGAQGSATIAGLRGLANIALLDHASGAAAWRGSLSLKKRSFELAVDSTLQGVAINLPSPLGKTAAETMALRIERTNSTGIGALKRQQLQSLPPRGDALAISLGSAVDAVFVRAREAGRLVVERGAVALGERAVLPERAGVVVSGALPHLDFDQWRGLMPAGGAGFPLSSVVMRLGTLDFGGKRLNAVAIRAAVAGESWNAAVSARELAGDVSWRPEGRGRIVARLKHFTVPDAAPGAASVEPPAKDLPALDIIADNFVARDRKLGRLELSAINQSRDWKIERLVLSNPESMLNAEGVWQSWAARPSISVNVRLEVTDVGRYLDRLGYPGTVRGGTAKLEGKVGWAGNPQTVDYPTLTGTLSLSADRGQFLKADPGIAKLLGVLSLQSLLTFDLRDMFREGFAFDSIAGTAKVAKGVLTTDDFRMRGKSALVSMSGDIDLARETQKLRMRVVPSVGDSASTVAAFLLANPIAALGAMIAQRVLKDPLGQIFAFEYDVTGSWDAPKVERARESPKPEAPR